MYNNSMQEQTTQRLPYLWDYDISEDEFRSLLYGYITMGRLNQDWAACRLIEYASYREIIRLLGFPRLIAGWPRWRRRIRSVSRKRGLDFLAAYIPEQHPEILHD